MRPHTLAPVFLGIIATLDEACYLTPSRHQITTQHRLLGHRHLFPTQGSPENNWCR